MNEQDRERAIARLRARRAARGERDPLNRLWAVVSNAIASGAPVVTEKRGA